LEAQLFAAFCQEYTREQNRLHGEAVSAASVARQEVADIGRKLDEASA
jgi:hypothetical protein